jgi:hypothetical protein
LQRRQDSASEKHSVVLLETKEVSIPTVPALSYSYQKGIERFTYQDLPEAIDYIVIT